jgi:tetratricopeptide (TPR) repeat protein
LFRLLDGLPLAIAQAAAYLQESGISLTKYIEFYEQRWKELMESQDKSSIPIQDYPNRSIWTTWTISYNAIQAKNKAASNMLLLWAWLDNKDLWYGLFAIACKESTGATQLLSKWLEDIASNEVKFTEAIKLLRNYSLIEDVEDMASYTTHPVVHRWALHFQGNNEQVELAHLAVTVVGWAVPHSSTREYMSLQRRLLPHAQHCLKWILTVYISDKEYDKPTAISTRREDIKVMLGAIHKLGNLYHDQGKLGEAEKMYQRALQGYEKALGLEHTSTLDTVNNLGILYRNQGKLGEAEKMYQRALQGYEKALGLEHTSTLNTVNNLGNLYFNQGKLGEAEKMYQSALQGYEKALDLEHTSTLSTVNNLGNLYHDQGKLGDAEKMYQRSLQGYKRAIGPEGVTSYIPALRTSWALGSLFNLQGNAFKAREMYSAALAGYEKVYGLQHTHCQALRKSLSALDGSKR